MKKILFLGAGSEKDPGFEPCYDKAQMKQRGIAVIDTVIESCHGCPDLMSKYSSQLQSLVDEGHRVVAVLEGGLYFALPSIQATQTTFPIISCPLDIVAYQAFMVPPGHAAIATVGVEASSGVFQRARAIDLATRILELKSDSVFTDSPLVKEEMEKYGINGSMATEGSQGLFLTFDSEPRYLNDLLPIWADKSSEKTAKHIDKLRNVIGSCEFPTLQVHGAQNLAIYAAKILSLSNPDLRAKIKLIAQKKRDTYKERDILNEVP